MDKNKGGKIHDFADGYISQSIDNELTRQGIDINLHPELKEEVENLKSKLNKDYKKVVKKNRLIKKLRAVLRAIIYIFALFSACFFLVSAADQEKEGQKATPFSTNRGIIFILALISGIMVESLGLLIAPDPK